MLIEQFAAGGGDFPIVAWCIFNGTNGTIIAGKNIASVVRNAAGDYTISFSAARPNTNYAVFGNCSTFAIAWGVSITPFAVPSAPTTRIAPTTTSFKLGVCSNNTALDSQDVFIMVIQ